MVCFLRSRPESGEEKEAGKAIPELGDQRTRTSPWTFYTGGGKLYVTICERDGESGF